jgi:L-threonine kinase
LTATWKVGVGTGAGTCGELVQGVLSDGRTFHVTCPINKCSTVKIRLRKSDEWQMTGIPPERQKLATAICSTAHEFGLGPCAVQVRHASELDVGKGLGSSTADIVAAARAVAAAVGGELSPAELAAMATSIEASDGSMYPQIIAFDRDGGALIRQFDWWPQLAVVMVIPSATLDTASADLTGQADLSHQFDRIVAGLDEAVIARDGAAFARAATESATFNQQFIPNHLFDVLAEEYESLGADGLNVAHTGTCLGLLFVLPERLGATYGDSAGAVLRNASFAVRRLQAMLPGDVSLDLSVTPACGASETFQSKEA